MSSQRLIAIGAAALFTLGLTGVGWAEEPAQEKRVKVIVKSKDCAGDDCGSEQRVLRRVFIDEDGVRQEVGGRHFTWTSDKVLGAPEGGFLGVMFNDLTAELRTHFGVPDNAGVMVSKVFPDTPAFRAGVAVGDIVTAVDGVAVNSPGSLARLIYQRRGGDTVGLELWRDGRVETLTATLEQRPSPHRAHARAFAFACDDTDGGDCEHHHLHATALACGDGDCEVTVECEGGDCDCTVNGEAVECARLHPSSARPSVARE